jgi:uncharacterized membrane protein YiaA
MPQPYNLTNLTSSDGLLGIFQATNSMVDNTFGIMILLLIWIVIFIRLKMYSGKAAFFAACFISALVGIMLFMMGMVSQTVLMMVIVLMGVAFVSLLFD